MLRYRLQLQDTKPAGWKDVEAETPEAAIVSELRESKSKAECVYVDIQPKFHHPNEAPLVVQRYQITWDVEAK